MSERLAIHGGRPVRQTLLPYGRQSIDDEDIAAVVEVLRGDWLTQGPAIARFEEAFAARLGVRHAVAVNSGTAALHAACFAAGLGPGDEAIVPAVTFAATSNAALYLGAKPVFADVDPATGVMDLDSFKRRITPRTKAVLPVHYAGLPVEMDPVREIAARRGLIVIEDACHALGATYRGKPAGALGQMGCFSFHPVKHITTGEGGVIVTDDDAFAARLRAFRTHGIEKDAAMMEAHGGWHYEMRHLGFNYRITDFQAALGLSQLNKLDRFVAERQALAGFYDAALADLPHVSFLRYDHAERSCAYHLYPLLFDLSALGGDKKTLFKALRAEGLGVQVHYIPVPRHPYYRALGYDPAATPGAEEFFRREISIPMFVGVSEHDRADVAAACRKVVQNLA